jgi:hypothetical protein
VTAEGTPIEDLIHFEHLPDGSTRIAPGGYHRVVHETAQGWPRRPDTTETVAWVARAPLAIHSGDYARSIAAFPDDEPAPNSRPMWGAEDPEYLDRHLRALAKARRERRRLLKPARVTR